MNRRGGRKEATSRVDHVAPASSPRLLPSSLSTIPYTDSPYTMAAVKGQEPNIGFDFSNYARNQHLGQRFGNLPKGESAVLARCPSRPWPVLQPSPRQGHCLAIARDFCLLAACQPAQPSQLLELPTAPSRTHPPWTPADPPATSTGTTIVGLKYGGGSSGEPEGVCLGADTRATAGPIVADKNCEKVSARVGRKGEECVWRVKGEGRGRGWSQNEGDRGIRRSSGGGRWVEHMAAWPRDGWHLWVG